MRIIREIVMPPSVFVKIPTYTFSGVVPVQQVKNRRTDGNFSGDPASDRMKHR